MAFSAVHVDEDRLDEEWINHPKLFYLAARKLADAKAAVAAAKAFLDVEEAEVEMDVRANPAKYLIKDVKESAIKLRVTLHLRVRDAEQALREAKHLQDVTDAKVNALEHKKRALENLVTLHGQNYFSTPRAKGADAGKVRSKGVAEKVKRNQSDKR